MMKQLWIVGFAFLAVSWQAEGQSWRDKYNQAQTQYSQGNNDQALLLGNEALNGYLAEGAPASEVQASILRLISVASYGLQDFNKGLEYATKEVLLRETKKDTVYATALVNKALFEEQLGHYDKAIESLTAARAVFASAYPQNHESVLACDLGLGSNYYLLNDFANARRWLNPALEAVEKNGEYSEEALEGYYYSGMVEVESMQGEAALRRFMKAAELFSSASLTESQTFALTLYGQGLSYQLLHQYDEAEKSLHEAQNAYEKISGKTGEGHHAILSARILNAHYQGKPDHAAEWLKQLQTTPSGKKTFANVAASLGNYYHGRGDLNKADGYYREALKGFSREKKDELLRYEETNLGLATLCADQGNTTESMQRIAESLSIVEKEQGKQSLHYFVALNRLGLVKAQTDDIAAATKAFGEALSLLPLLGNVPQSEKSILIIGLGDLEIQAGRYRRGDSLYMEVIRPHDTQGKSPDKHFAAALVKLAVSKQLQGNYSEALALTRRSVTVTRTLFGTSSQAFANAMENEAIMRIRMGDLTAAKGKLDSALVLYEKASGKESLQYAYCLMSLGRYYQVAGDYTKAEPCFKNARNIIRAAKGIESAEYANAQNGLALLYQTLGNYRDAEAALKQSKIIIEKKYGTMHPEYATVVQNLAALYQLEGAYDKAEPLQREALEIDRKTLGENHLHYAITLQNMATLNQKLGKRTEARGMLEKVLESHRKLLGIRHPSYITTLSNLAALYQDMGDFSRAEITWKQSAELRKEVLGEDHPDYARSIYGLAGVFHAQGQWAKAKSYYEPVVEKYQKQVEDLFPALSEKEKGAFYAKIKPVFDAYQDFFVQYLHTFPAERNATLGKLYDLQLSTKAILLTATGKVRARIMASGNPELQAMFRDWLATKEQIVRFYSASTEERLRSGLSIPQLESHANDLEKKLSELSDAFRSQVEREKITWTNVRDALKPGEVAVEILRIRRKYVKDSVYYVGLVVEKASTAPELVVWRYGAQLEGKKFKYHRNTIKYHVNDTLSYNYYWRPLEEKVKPGATLYLSCDGVFNKVNFNSLFESNRRRFVIDDYRLHQLSNTRELAERMTTRKPIPQTAALFGYADFNLGEADVVSHSSKRNLARSLGFEGETIPVLPATEKEVDEVAALLSQNAWTTQSYKRTFATEENLKKAVSPKLIHIATHGFFLSDVDLEDTEHELSQNPLFRSGVLLAGAAVDREESKREDDGVLTAYEAMNLNLDQTDLVVLSACETGLGEVRNGEGVYGLQRSFIVAGASTVLMSLWQVDDVATQQLMNAFYANWLGGTEKHEAFRKAQLQMKDKYQIPYFWGAFVLIGN